MSGGRAVLIGVAACLASSLVALQPDCFGFAARDWDCVSARAGSAGEDLPRPGQGGSFAGLVDSVPPFALATGTSQDWDVDLWLVCKRLRPARCSAGSEKPGSGFFCCWPVPNWVLTFLPKSEFCTLLSRFRI
jgi:hypothetical protein